MLFTLTISFNISPVKPVACHVKLFGCLCSGNISNEKFQLRTSGMNIFVKTSNYVWNKCIPIWIITSNLWNLLQNIKQMQTWNQLHCEAQTERIVCKVIKMAFSSMMPSILPPWRAQRKYVPFIQCFSVNYCQSECEASRCECVRSNTLGNHVTFKRISYNQIKSSSYPYEKRRY